MPKLCHACIVAAIAAETVDVASQRANVRGAAMQMSLLPSTCAHQVQGPDSVMLRDW